MEYNSVWEECSLFCRVHSHPWVRRNWRICNYTGTQCQCCMHRVSCKFCDFVMVSVAPLFSSFNYCTSVARFTVRLMWLVQLYTSLWGHLPTASLAELRMYHPHKRIIWMQSHEAEIGGTSTSTNEAHHFPWLLDDATSCEEPWAIGAPTVFSRQVTLA